MAPLQLCHVDG